MLQLCQQYSPQSCKVVSLLVQNEVDFSSQYCLRNGKRIVVIVYYSDRGNVFTVRRYASTIKVYAIIAMAMSVCPSVTSLCSVKSAKRIIT